MAGLQHSNLLFIKDNVPLKFWLRPSGNKGRIRRLIEHGGGEVVPKMAAGVIRLAEPCTKVLSEGAISTKFIDDCVQADSLLALSSYKVNPNMVECVSDFSDIENPSIYVRRRVRIGTQPYSRNDQEVILKWICDNKRYSEVKGRKMWKVMEDLEIVKNRSWQSLKEHFNKKILPNLQLYKKVITPHQMAKFSLTYSNEPDSSLKLKNSSDEMETEQSVSFYIPPATVENKSFKYREDLEIIEFILNTKSSSSIRGNVIWRMMEKQKVTRHSWQSMKERFLKRILRDLSQYSLSNMERSKLLKRAGGISENMEPSASSSPLCLRKSKKRRLNQIDDVNDTTPPLETLSSFQKVENFLSENAEKSSNISQEFLATEFLKDSNNESLESHAIDRLIANDLPNSSINGNIDTPMYQAKNTSSGNHQQNSKNSNKNHKSHPLDELIYDGVINSSTNEDVGVNSAKNVSCRNDVQQNVIKGQVKLIQIESSSDDDCSTELSGEQQNKMFRSILNSKLKDEETKHSQNVYKSPDIKMLASALSDSDFSEAERQDNRKKFMKDFICISSDEDSDENIKDSSCEHSDRIIRELKGNKELDIKEFIKWLTAHHPQAESILRKAKEGTSIKDILS